MSNWDWIARANELRERKISFAISTITNVIGSSPRDIGAKMFVEDSPKNPIHGTIGGGALERQVIEDSIKLLASGESKNITYKIDESVGQRCGGTVEVMIEIVKIACDLYLFGAGHVGQALCRVLEGTPFCVHLIDERDEWVNSPNVAASVKRHHQDWQHFVESASWSRDNTFVAIMTYDHHHDLDILESVLKRDFRYVGVIGSKSKWAKFQKDLKEKDFPKELIDQVNCPIGMKLGGKAPAEVAISIAAELLEKYYQYQSEIR